MGNIYTKLKQSIMKKIYCKKVLKIPHFDSNFKSKKNFVDILENCKSTYEGVLIKEGKICNNVTDIYLTEKKPCIILIWDSDNHDFKSRGLGVYVGSGVIITAQHVLKKYKNEKVFVLFQNKTFSLAYNINKDNIVFHNDYDFAEVKLDSNSDKLSNILPVELDILYENKNLYFYGLKAGHYVKVKCKITEAVNKDLNPKEFTLSKTGNYGDSGTPIFTSSGKCVAIYLGAFEKTTSKKLKCGIGLQFDSDLIKRISSMNCPL